MYNGLTTGMPISLQIKNKDQKSSDYKHISNSFRPSHADFTYEKKYGARDYRGGGRSSARETANWVAAGAIAKKILHSLDISINAYVSKVGKCQIDIDYKKLDFSKIESNIVRCPDNNFANKLIALPDNYGSSNKNKKKYLVEFVSANPTGPLHVGHCRGAILGDVISNLLKFNENIVEREYYVNDHGNQIYHFNYSYYS